jgi:hypothetical protein
LNKALCLEIPALNSPDCSTAQVLFKETVETPEVGWEYLSLISTLGTVSDTNGNFKLIILKCCNQFQCGGNAVDIATGYRLYGRGVGLRVLIGSTFSLIHIVQTDSEAQPVFYPMDTGEGISLGPKRQGREVDHLSLTSAKAKETWTNTSTQPHIFIT